VCVLCVLCVCVFYVCVMYVLCVCVLCVLVYVFCVGLYVSYVCLLRVNPLNVIKFLPDLKEQTQLGTAKKRNDKR